MIVVGATQPVGRGRDGPGPGPQPARRTGPVGAVAGQQLLDGPGGLPVQLALALTGGQAADLGRNLGRRPADGTVGVDDHDLRAQRYSAQGPRPLRAEVVGMPSGRSTRRNRDAATRTPSSATGRSSS